MKKSWIKFVAARLLPALVSILVTGGLYASGEIYPGDIQSYSLGMSDGLANSSVFCAVQDKTGFMWFGTFGGLSRYDGAEFKTWRPEPGSGKASLPASVVFALLADSSGYLWVATDGGGLARYERYSDSFTVFKADAGIPNSLSSDKVFALAEDRKGMIWIGTGDGMIDRFDPGTGLFAHFPAGELGLAYPARIRTLLCDRTGIVWAGTEGGGLVRHDPETGAFETFRHLDTDGKSLADNVVRSLFEDSRGRLWIGLGSGGIDLYTGNGFSHASGGDRFLTEAVRALGEDPDGRIWVGYSDSGIGLIDPESLILASPHADFQLSVRTIYRDNRGLMWVGTKGGGVYSFNLKSSQFNRFEKTGEGIRLRDMRGLAADGRGSVLAGSDGGGLLVLEPGSGMFRRHPDMPGDFMSQKVYAVLSTRDGSVWVGTDGGGLVVIKDGLQAVYKSVEGDERSIPGNVVWALYEDRDGSIWVGTEGGGLARTRPGTDVFIRYRSETQNRASIQGSSIRTILRDSADRLWVGTWDGGLSRMEGDSGIWMSYGPDSSNPSSLGDMSVNCVFEDSQGLIWVGTGGSGIALLDPVTGTFVHLDESDGLAGQTVYGIVEDGKGRYWISTATGLSCYDRERGTLFNFGEEDGLSSSELTQNSLLLAGDGNVWVGALSGITRFDPARLAMDEIPPSVSINNITFFDSKSEIALKDGRASVTLGYGNTGFSFDISVLDFVAPDRNLYAMKLDGRQTEWTNLGKQNNSFIGPLSPGRYVLRVKGANGNGIWSDSAASMEITVNPPFWNEWWFRFAVFGFSALAVFWVFKSRMNALQKHNALLVSFSRHIETAREDERIAAAREVHDGIGQPLAVGNLQTYWLKSHPDAPGDIRAEKLEELTSSIAEAMAAVKSVSTSLRPVALDTLSLDSAFHWYVSSFERRSGIVTSLEIDGNLPAVGGDLSTALFRILQEMMTNVLRHSRASKAGVSLFFREGCFVLEVKDDGIGMAKGLADAPDSFGIIGMRERCSFFGGTLDVSAGDDNRGTKISVAIPAGRGRDHA